MIYKVLILQFIAHFFADFIFQPHRWVVKKRQKMLTWSHFWHFLAVMLLSYVFSLDFGYWKLALFIGFTHLYIDVSKSILQIKTNWKDSSLFFIDQSIHVLTILILTTLYYLTFGANFLLDIPINYIAIFAGFVFCAKPSNIIIKNIFDLFEIKIPKKITHSEPTENDELPNAGKVIGVMERYLVLSLILVNQYSVVGLIIAAKSILRFKDNKKNEYVLVGTLLSFGIATILGIAISFLLVN